MIDFALGFISGILICIFHFIAQKPEIKNMARNIINPSARKGKIVSMEDPLMEEMRKVIEE